MANIVSISDIQAWLNKTRYRVSSIDDSVYDEAVGVVFGKVSRRYDVSLWIDENTAPSLIKSAIAMHYAGTYIRRAGSEEDGLVGYADWLQERVKKVCSGIVDGSVSLVGVKEDPTSVLSSGPTFGPTNKSTNLYLDTKLADGSTNEPSATPMYFDSNMSF